MPVPRQVHPLVRRQTGRLCHPGRRLAETNHCLYTEIVYNVYVTRCVTISSTAQKQLRRVPQHVALKLQAWIEAVEVHGLETVRKVTGFHDEPLKGRRKGQRSIRLSRAYRAIYEIQGKTLAIAFVEVKEVHKHAY